MADAKTTKKDLVGKSEKELQAMVHQMQGSLQKFRFGVSGGKAKNVKEGKNLRKDIARVMTEMSARRVAAKKA